MSVNVALCEQAAPSAKVIKKEIELETKDAHILKAELTYPKTKEAKLPTVVLLHSLGYNSSYWAPLTSILNQKGYAVLAMDFRGHGKSVYNAAFRLKSWTYFTNKTFAKYPTDVMAMIDEVQANYKKADFTNYAIIGADIGANTAVMVARQYSKKPKALVLISPMLSFKGLYIPIVMSELGSIPVLAIASTKDTASIREQDKLSKFAQGQFYIKNYPQGGTGMLMIKSNPSLANDIATLLGAFFK